MEDNLPQLNPSEIIMCGDTRHKDILGAKVRGWPGVLMTQDGMFSGHETDILYKESGIFADSRVKRIKHSRIAGMPTMKILA